MKTDTYMKALRFTFFFFCLLLINIQVLSSQKIDWYLEPVITDADEIVRIYKDHELVLIKSEDEFSGIKNFKNKLIVPVKYKSLWILESEKAIKASEKFSGGKQDFYDFEGNRIDDIPKRKVSRILREQTVKRKKEKLEAYFRKFPKINFVEDESDKKRNHTSRVRYMAINSKGDTIINNISYNPNFNIYLQEVCGKYIFRKGKFFNFDGDLIKDFGGVLSFRELDNGWMTIYYLDDGFHLYDQDLNFILKEETGIRSIIDSRYYITGGYLKKLTGKQINSKPFKRVYKIEGTDCYSLENDDDGYAQIYNAETDKLFDLKYRHGYRNGEKRKKDNLQVVTENGKYGVVNMCDGKLLLEIEYGYAKVHDNYLVTAPAEFTKGKYEFNTYSILDRDGREIKTEFVREPRCFEDLIILKTKESQNLYDGDFNVVKELDYYEEYYFSDLTKTLTYVNFDAQERRNYFIKDILKGVDREYGHIEMIDSYKPGRKMKNFFPALGVNGLKGAMNALGEIIIPFVLDDILNIDHDNRDLIIVKKDGKLGIIKYP